ncbi:hypothetical protein C8R46DRAFT_1035820 [Mycena filopes]|nr:hypothetical protein C8R46DRAFT_1035820 [Mycena filopes]
MTISIFADIIRLVGLACWFWPVINLVLWSIPIVLTALRAFSVTTFYNAISDYLVGLCLQLVGSSLALIIRVRQLHSNVVTWTRAFSNSISVYLTDRSWRLVSSGLLVIVQVWQLCGDAAPRALLNAISGYLADRACRLAPLGLHQLCNAVQRLDVLEVQSAAFCTRDEILSALSTLQATLEFGNVLCTEDLVNEVRKTVEVAISDHLAQLRAVPSNQYSVALTAHAAVVVEQMQQINRMVKEIKTDVENLMKAQASNSLENQRILSVFHTVTKGLSLPPVLPSSSRNINYRCSWHPPPPTLRSGVGCVWSLDCIPPER